MSASSPGATSGMSSSCQSLPQPSSASASGAAESMVGGQLGVEANQRHPAKLVNQRQHTSPLRFPCSHACIPSVHLQACSRHAAQACMHACESATPAAGGGAARAAGGASSQRLKTASSCALVGTAAASAVHASVGLRELQVSHSLPACLHAPHACTACMHVSTASLHTPFALRLAFLRRVRSCLRCSAAWLEASLCLFRVPGLAPALLPRGIDQAVMS